MCFVVLSLPLLVTIISSMFLYVYCLALLPAVGHHNLVSFLVLCLSSFTSDIFSEYINYLSSKCPFVFLESKGELSVPFALGRDVWTDEQWSHNQNQNFSHRWVAIFPFTWYSARAPSEGRSPLRIKAYCDILHLKFNTNKTHTQKKLHRLELCPDLILSSTSNIQTVVVEVLSPSCISLVMKHFMFNFQQSNSTIQNYYLFKAL